MCAGAPGRPRGAFRGGGLPALSPDSSVGPLEALAAAGLRGGGSCTPGHRHWLCAQQSGIPTSAAWPPAHTHHSREGPFHRPRKLRLGTQGLPGSGQDPARTSSPGGRPRAPALLGEPPAGTGEPEAPWLPPPRSPTGSWGSNPCRCDRGGQRTSGSHAPHDQPGPLSVQRGPSTTQPANTYPAPLGACRLGHVPAVGLLLVALRVWSQDRAQIKPSPACPGEQNRDPEPHSQVGRLRPAAPCPVLWGGAHTVPRLGSRAPPVPPCKYPAGDRQGGPASDPSEWIAVAPGPVTVIPWPLLLQAGHTLPQEQGWGPPGKPPCSGHILVPHSPCGAGWAGGPSSAREEEVRHGSTAALTRA